MDLQAKELRLVILGLRQLLSENMEKLKTLDDDTEEFVHIANDASLIELLIDGLQDEYERKFGSNSTS